MQDISRWIKQKVRGVARGRAVFWVLGLSLATAVGATLYATTSNTVEEEAQLRFDNMNRATQYSISARV